MSNPTDNLFQTGIRPAINQHLAVLAEEERDYGEYWSASSAGYCMRKVIFDRLKVPTTADEVDEARKQRVFSSGHIFHEWIQRITKNAGLSVLQEFELEDEPLKIRGHVDDLVVVDNHLVTYDYKTVHSDSFHYAKERDFPVSHYHKMQVGTYMYMLRELQAQEVKPAELDSYEPVSEARVLKISKDDLTMYEQKIVYTPALEKVILSYWNELNDWWEQKKFPPCTCDVYENGFMAKAKYNPYFYKGEPCSLKWYKLNREKQNADSDR